MGIIAKAISTVAYNPDIPVVSFRHNNWRVIINKREIMVKEIVEEADAVALMNYLEGIIERGNKNRGK